eukprot:3668617-Pyramimonas_sp.AAC.1
MCIRDRSVKKNTEETKTRKAKHGEYAEFGNFDEYDEHGVKLVDVRERAKKGKEEDGSKYG